MFEKENKQNKKEIWKNLAYLKDGIWGKNAENAKFPKKFFSKKI